MRIYSPATFLTLFMLVPTLSGQVDGDNTLISVNGNKVSAGEFEWIYLKNNSGTGKSSPDEYLNLYISFLLKVEEAKEAGIDKTAAFKRELEGYRRQLARNYLTDQGIKEELLKKAYERSLEEISVLHVMVKCPLDAPPADTMMAWQKAMKLRERIRLGEPFESVARGASDDPNVTTNGGYLGYITAFQTPMPFENAIYSMSPGGLSRPVRTAGGYHIIKIQDRRRASGRIRVAHIMKAVPYGATATQEEMARNSIDSIYRVVANGADFGTTAMDCSDDLASAAKGGELPWFGTGEMITEFSEKAFELMHDGDVSEPVKTFYGWHIIKRLEKQPVQSYEEARKTLESKLNQSFLLSLSRKSFAEKLKKEYNFRLNREMVEWFYTQADSSFRAGNYQITDENMPAGMLFSFESVTCSARQFMDFIRQRAYQISANDSIRFINSLIDLKSYEDLIKYEDSLLESKYPEFRYLVNEFYNGILLFEISDSLIWSRSVSDTAGLRDYYETRKNEFITPAQADGIIYTIDKKLGKRRTVRLIRTIRKNDNDEEGMDMIMREAISGSDTLLKVLRGSWESGSDNVLDSFKWTRGYHQANNSDYSYLVYFSQVREPGYPPFEEIKDKLSGDYMKILEDNWIAQLRASYPVIVDMEVFDRLKEKLEKL